MVGTNGTTTRPWRFAPGVCEQVVVRWPMFDDEGPAFLAARLAALPLVRSITPELEWRGDRQLRLYARVNTGTRCVEAVTPTDPAEDTPAVRVGVVLAAAPTPPVPPAAVARPDEAVTVMLEAVAVDRLRVVAAHMVMAPADLAAAIVERRLEQLAAESPALFRKPSRDQVLG